MKIFVNIYSENITGVIFESRSKIQFIWPPINWIIL